MGIQLTPNSGLLAIGKFEKLCQPCPDCDHATVAGIIEQSASPVFHTGQRVIFPRVANYWTARIDGVDYIIAPHGIILGVIGDDPERRLDS